MSIELKIKSKHLSEEAKTIRFEERKLKAKARWERYHQGHTTADETMRKFHNINHHRRTVVRQENRATFLARAFIEGRAYAEVEANRKADNEIVFLYFVLPRVVDMVSKYSWTVNRDIILNWVDPT